MSPTPPTIPISEAELHALVDGQLTPERRAEAEAWLAERPEEAARVAAYREQRQALRALFEPVLDEPLPARLLAAAGPRLPWYRQPLVAGLALALLGGATGWGLRGELAPATLLALDGPAAAGGPAALLPVNGLARRAAVAHAVYSPEQRRPVEVDAAHEEQLVTWLSKRMGARMQAPQLQGLGWALEGGRLLPGAQGPVAQFMYRRDAAEPGMPAVSQAAASAADRLTLYVSREGARDLPGAAASGAGSAFRFVREGDVNVFYWVEGEFGYAISAQAGRGELAQVSSEVYRQLLSRQR